MTTKKNYRSNLILFASFHPILLLAPPSTVYVKSNTLLGDTKHATGVVLSEIVAANIPVRNGVVHLIKRPLMIVDTTVTEFLQVSLNVATKLATDSKNTYTTNNNNQPTTKAKAI